MRVILLAATMICASWLPTRAEPVTATSEASGLVEHVSLNPASGPIAELHVAAAKVEPLDATNVRPLEIETLAVARRGPGDVKLGKVKVKPSHVDQLKKTNAKVSALEGGPANVAGLTGAMRDVEMNAGASPWLKHALEDVGTNPTGWKRLWCAKSVNLWLAQSGKKGCGGNTAVSCLSAGRKLSGPQVGAIAVMKHHVGIVKEVHGGHVTLVSGNNAGRSGNRKVGISKYARGRVMAYVWPE
jgi:hypothetical protein